ncbi:hypothetical protein DY000_02056524 [Brassica cretica]|uniref:Aspartate/glutamate/uridylate kinase domain-containing protein n=1 Tax=Brassica cretica TaxID=69181 RepID=A0ABQ7AIT7_BRACR|nr:hypothetical protein DY000_02056524 [Brassica cretica]
MATVTTNAPPKSFSFSVSNPLKRLITKSPSLCFPHRKKHQRLCLSINAAVSSPPSTDTRNAPSPDYRVEILSESLPFIQKFRGKTIVVKYGGAAMTFTFWKKGMISSCQKIPLYSFSGHKRVSRFAVILSFAMQIADDWLKKDESIDILKRQSSSTEFYKDRRKSRLENCV